jgi:hypothetical protein
MSCYVASKAQMRYELVANPIEGNYPLRTPSEMRSLEQQLDSHEMYSQLVTAAYFSTSARLQNIESHCHVVLLQYERPLVLTLRSVDLIQTF